MSDTTANEMIEGVRFAHGVFRDLLGNVRDDQWDDPTPSDEWNVRQLVNHVIQGNRWVERNVIAEGADFPKDDFVSDQDPVAAFDASYRDLISAIDAAVAEGRLNEWFVGTRVAEFMIHGWDLAKATGQDTNIAPELNESLLAEFREGFKGYDRSKDGLYKDELPVPDDLPAADRFAAFLGKQP
jgi:uncharacterized protein (TIGR03086 family)